MRLQKIHIENFGKLHDITLTFPEDLTVFVRENGWGKSTLASFVKVMFYGFANEKKRGDTLERERVRFKPWQGGVYGGELQFAVNGKSYLLNRTFGNKDSEDTFALYDAATNLETTDFALEDSRTLGEELFQINEESFLRTVYIAQNDCVTGTTDSINAKMGNLADHLDDISNYETARQSLKDLQNRMAPGRKTGSLKQQKDRLEELKNELRKQEPLEKSLRELEERLESSRQERDRLRERSECLKKEWTQANRYQELFATREHYERILRGRDEKREAVEAALKAFGGQAPEKERLQEAMRQRSALIRQETERQANALDEEERGTLSVCRKRFAAGVPEDAFFAEGKKLTEELDALYAEEARNCLSSEELKEFVLLRERVGTAAVSEDRIDHMQDLWNVRMEKKGSLGTKKATLASLKALEDSAKGRERKPVSRLLFLLPVCLMAAGAAICLWQLIAGIVLIAAGIALLPVVALVCGRKRPKAPAAPSGAAILEQEIAADEEAIAAATREVLEFLRAIDVPCSEEERAVRDALYGLKDDMKRLQRLQARKADYEQKRYFPRIKELQLRLIERISPYFSEQERQEKREYELVVLLEKQKQDFLRLQAKEQRFLQAEQECAALRSSVQEFLAKYGGGGADPDADLEELVRRLSVYEADCKALEEQEAQRQAFEESHDMTDRKEPLPEAPRPITQIEQEQQAVEEQLEEVSAAIRSYLKQFDDRQAEAEELDAVAEQLAELTEQYQKDSAYYHHVELVSEYLTKAKESFSAKYMGPIMDAYRKYYGMMSGDDGEEFRMDANIRITKREEGEQRDLRAFSAGEQDLTGIAFRMALIDAMYGGEKPFLLFDDSFTNLDEARLERAKRFLREVSKEYQVIYFTCHGSRAE